MDIHAREIDENEIDLVKQAIETDLLGTVTAMLLSSELLSNLLFSDPLPEVAANAMNYALRLKENRCISRATILYAHPQEPGTSIIDHLQEQPNFLWHHSVDKISLISSAASSRSFSLVLLPTPDESVLH